jgi:alpha,alpha-trehalose phosphorylase
VIAAEVGHLDLAYDYFGEAALMDLHDLENNTRDGVHIASLAGTWIAAVAGFGGMRDHGGVLTFAPRLPSRLERLTFGLLVRGTRLRVQTTKTEATYSVVDGDPLELTHHGTVFTVGAAEPVTLPIPATPDRPRPKQPPGREPARRG